MQFRLRTPTTTALLRALHLQSLRACDCTRACTQFIKLAHTLVQLARAQLYMHTHALRAHAMHSRLRARSPIATTRPRAFICRACSPATARPCAQNSFSLHAHLHSSGARSCKHTHSLRAHTLHSCLRAHTIRAYILACARTAIATARPHAPV